MPSGTRPRLAGVPQRAAQRCAVEPELTTADLVIRPPVPEDAPEAFELLNDPDVRAGTPRATCPDLETAPSVVPRRRRLVRRHPRHLARRRPRDRDGWSATSACSRSTPTTGSPRSATASCPPPGAGASPGRWSTRVTRWAFESRGLMRVQLEHAVAQPGVAAGCRGGRLRPRGHRPLGVRRARTASARTATSTAGWPRTPAVTALRPARSGHPRASLPDPPRPDPREHRRRAGHRTARRQLTALGRRQARRGRRGADRAGHAVHASPLRPDPAVAEPLARARASPSTYAAGLEEVWAGELEMASDRESVETYLGTLATWMRARSAADAGSGATATPRRAVRRRGGAASAGATAPHDAVAVFATARRSVPHSRHPAPPDRRSTRSSSAGS